MTKSLSSHDVVKMLHADGWSMIKSVGDHHHFKHGTKAGKVTVTHPVKALPVGTSRSIYRQAGWNWSERN